MKELVELSPYLAIYFLCILAGFLVNGMPIIASLIFSLIFVLIILWVWSFIYLTITHILKWSNRDMNVNIFGLSATLVTLFFIIISL